MELTKELLKSRLLEEGYIESNGLDRTVENLLGLEGKAREALETWIATGKVVNFEPIEGIDRRYLRDKLKMKDPAIILAYGMLLAEPKYNAMFLKRQTNRRNAVSFRK